MFKLSLTAFSETFITRLDIVISLLQLTKANEQIEWCSYLTGRRKEV